MKLYMSPKVNNIWLKVPAFPANSKGVNYFTYKGLNTELIPT